MRAWAIVLVKCNRNLHDPLHAYARARLICGVVHETFSVKTPSLLLLGTESTWRNRLKSSTISEQSLRIKNDFTRSARFHNVDAISCHSHFQFPRSCRMYFGSYFTVATTVKSTTLSRHGFTWWQLPNPLASETARTHSHGARKIWLAISSSESRCLSCLFMSCSFCIIASISVHAGCM